MGRLLDVRYRVISILTPTNIQMLGWVIGSSGCCMGYLYPVYPVCYMQRWLFSRGDKSTNSWNIDLKLQIILAGVKRALISVATQSTALIDVLFRRVLPSMQSLLILRPKEPRKKDVLKLWPKEPRRKDVLKVWPKGPHNFVIFGYRIVFV